MSKDQSSDVETVNKKPLQLKIDAQVIKQLGAELISGSEIALVELVKNSFDADSKYCHIYP